MRFVKKLVPNVYLALLLVAAEVIYLGRFYIEELSEPLQGF